MTDADLLGLRDGFAGYYRRSDAEWRLAFSDGIVVLDASALLDLYRLSPNGRNELFGVLGKLREQLFVPRQVALEFHRRRVDAVAGRLKEFDEADQALENSRQRAIAATRAVATRSHLNDQSAQEVAAAISGAFDSAKQFVERARAEYDLDPDALAASDDPVLARLEPLLAGRVAAQVAQELLDKDLKEAEVRASARRPPGFKDASKADNPYGDYLWWAEAKRFAAGRYAHVVIVSNDTAKADWTLEVRGMRIGAHPDLVEEMQTDAGAALFFCTTAELLAGSTRYLDLEVSERTINEARALPEASAQRGPQRYVPVESVAELLRLSGEEWEYLIDDGMSSAEDESMWTWNEVRELAVATACLRSGIQPEVARRAARSVLTRRAGRNQLVIRDSEVEWVRRRDLPDVIGSEEQDPDLVLDLAKVDKSPRYIFLGMYPQRLNVSEREALVDGDEAG